MRAHPVGVPVVQTDDAAVGSRTDAEIKAAVPIDGNIPHMRIAGRGKISDHNFMAAIVAEGGDDAVVVGIQMSDIKLPVSGDHAAHRAVDAEAGATRRELV